MLFERPSTNVAYEKIQYVDYRPTMQLSNAGSLDFIIPPTTNQYINLKKTYLKLKMKIVKSDGSAIPIKTLVTCTNLPLHSCFNQVDVLLQQQLVSSTGSQTYAYKAYIETMLEYGSDAKNSQLHAQGYEKDQPLMMEVKSLEDTKKMFGPDHTVSEKDGGYISRWLYFVANNSAEFMGPLNADICQQNRLILNGVEIQIKMWPSKDTFRLGTTDETNPYKMEILDATLKVCKVTPSPSLLSKDTFRLGTTDETNPYKMEILDATLKVCKVTPSPSLLLAHTAGLKESPALYPYTKTQIKTFNVPSGQYNFHLDDLFQGELPSHMVISMVTAKAFKGDYKLNPFNMKHFNMNSLGVYANDESLPAKPLQMSFTRYKHVEAYYSMFAGLNKDGEDWGNDISREEYAHGNTFFVFDLLPGNQPQGTPNMQKANIRVEGAFDEALTENITIIVYARFPSMLKITEDRSILI